MGYKNLKKTVVAVSLCTALLSTVTVASAGELANQPNAEQTSESVNNPELNQQSNFEAPNLNPTHTAGPAAEPMMDSRYCQKHPDRCANTSDTPTTDTDDDTAGEGAQPFDIQKDINDHFEDLKESADSHNFAPSSTLADQLAYDYLEMLTSYLAMLNNVGSTKFDSNPTGPFILGGNGITDDQLNGQSDAANSSNSSSCPNTDLQHAAFCLGGILLGANMAFGTHGAEGAAVGGAAGWLGEWAVVIGLLGDCTDLCEDEDKDKDGDNTSDDQQSSGSDSSDQGGTSSNNDGSDKQDEENDQ